MPTPISDHPLGSGREQVRLAAENLVAVGVYPSIKAVMDVLGKGQSTVEYHRKKLIARGEWPVPARARGERGKWI